MTTRTIKSNATVTLVIDGVMLQTTAKLLRQGAMSNVLYNAFREFEHEYIAYGIIGKVASYRDDYLNRDVHIQIDLH